MGNCTVGSNPTLSATPPQFSRCFQLKFLDSSVMLVTTHGSSFVRGQLAPLHIPENEVFCHFFWGIYLKVAERVGFEPTVSFPTTVFKTAALSHSAISPDQDRVAS